MSHDAFAQSQNDGDRIVRITNVKFRNFDGKISYKFTAKNLTGMKTKIQFQTYFLDGDDFKLDDNVTFPYVFKTGESRVISESWTLTGDSPHLFAKIDVHRVPW